MSANWAFRCDASQDIGCGHVMRMIAIAEAAAKFDISIVWLVNSDAASIIKARNKSSDRAIEIIVECTSTALIKSLVKQHQVDLLIFDGYHFQGEYIERCVDDNDCFIAIVDDNADIDWPKVDCIINGGFGAKQLGYKQQGYKQQVYKQGAAAKNLVLGPEYYLLRQEFTNALQTHSANKPKPQPNTQHIKCLVMFGGSDPLQLTDWFVSHADHWPANVSYAILIGEKTCLADETINLVKHSEHVELIYSSSNMAELIARQDFVISAAGGTLYECAFFEKCTLAMIVAPNQIRAAKAISTALHWPQPIHVLDIKSQAQQMLSSINNFIEQQINKPQSASSKSTESKIIDGKGAQRVVKKLVGFLSEQSRIGLKKER
jgi:UDP-2,4-diacetamido-2,4,6-trideoxy-beta-L-altropyranose hydrolase